MIINDGFEYKMSEEMAKAILSGRKRGRKEKAFKRISNQLYKILRKFV